MDIYKKLKIMTLTRRLAEVEGNIKFWSKLIARWEEQRKLFESKRFPSVFANIETGKLDGNINFNRTRIAHWRIESNSIRKQLEELGVEVRANI